MPKITGNSIAEHRALTRAKILTAFGELFYERGLQGVTLSLVAERSGVGRTAMYNYFTDKEELLVEYTQDQTRLYIDQLHGELLEVDNPVDQLGVFIRSQARDIASRHLPPGPAIRSVISEESFAKLRSHVDELSGILDRILQAGRRQGYLPELDVPSVAGLVMSCIASPATSRLSGEDLEEALGHTVDFVLRAVGARLGADGRPRKLDGSASAAETDGALAEV